MYKVKIYINFCELQHFYIGWLSYERPAQMASCDSPQQKGKWSQMSKNECINKQTQVSAKMLNKDLFEHDKLTQ